MLNFLIHDKRVHFDSLYANGEQLFISLFVHNVESHHFCNHKVHKVMMFVTFCRLSPSTSTPLIFALHIQIFLHSSLTSRPTPMMYPHPYITVDIQTLAVWDWFISLSMIFSNSNLSPAKIIILFIFMTE